MYEQCAKKYYHIKVAKDAKDADSQWAGDGKDIHDALKKRVIDNKPLPLNLRHMEKMAAKFANAKGEKYGELQFALNEQYEPVDWFAKDAWVRAIIDLLIINGKHALLVDWKTGKVKEEYDQIKLSAAVLAQQMPELEEFSLAYVWTKHRKISPLTMRREHMADVWADYLPRVQAIKDALKTTDFPADPSGLCGWCPVTQCPHHVQRQT